MQIVSREGGTVGYPLKVFGVWIPSLRWNWIRYGLRRWLIVTSPWRDWVELRPIKRRLGIHVPGPANDKWFPSRSTIVFWCGVVIGALFIT